MSRPRLLASALVVSTLFVGGWRGGQAPTGVDEARLKAMLKGLGYAVTEPGPGTFEIALKTSNLKIPTRVFLAKNRAKVWLSASLLQKEVVARLTPDDLRRLLAANLNVGPCAFMLDGGWLKLKLALDNRALTAPILRQEIDYLTARLAETRPIWNKTLNR